ncbi:hypothetical protein D3C78_1291160 [compost metagenome]
MGPHQHCEPLPHIENLHLCLPMSRHQGMRPQRRQPQRHSQQAQGHPGRKQQQQSTKHRQGHRPDWRRHRLPGRRQSGDGSQQAEQQLQQSTRAPDQSLADEWHPQQQTAQQCQRDHGEFDPGHCDQVGQRPTKAHRQAQSQQHRRQSERHQPLRPRPGAPPGPSAQPAGKTEDQ